MSMMVSFVLSFFPRDVLDEILNLIESVSEDFPSYSYFNTLKKKHRFRFSAMYCIYYWIFRTLFLNKTDLPMSIKSN